MKNSNVQYSSFENAPYMPLPRNRNHAYWKELEEVLPQKVKLAKDLQLLLKPVNTYNSWNHNSYIYGTSKCLDNPLNIIKNAYNMKVDTSQYRKNRNYYSNLYKSMRSADVSHQDILAVYGNPYIGTVTKWNELSWQRKQNILKDYPGTDGIANRINEAKQALTFELAAADYDTKQFIQDFVIVGLSVWAEKQFKLPNTLMAPVYATRMERAFAYIQPKYEKIAYKLSDRAGKLYRKAEDFFKKKLNTEANPRIGTSGYKMGKHWNNLKPVNTPEMQRQIGKINKQAFGGGEIRTDGKCIYRFDQGHQTAKIHIERYKKVKNNHWRADAECDPQTGEPIPGSIDKLSKKPRHIKW